MGVVKSAQYEQTPGTPPTPLATNAYAFTAFVVPATNYAVTNAVFRAPNVSTNRTLTLSTNGDFLQFSQTFQTQSALEASYPSSSSIFSPSVYRFTLDTVHDGTRAANASYLLASTPPIPQVTNLGEGQSVDTTTDFTVRWVAMGGLLGIVQLLVLDAGSNIVYSSPVPFTTNALTQASTSAAIPRNTLPPAANLTGHLVFAQPGLPDTNSYPGAVGIAAHAKDTAFPLITRPTPVPPRLQIVAPGPLPVVLQFTGETNREYHLQAATNLVSPVWVDLLVTNMPTSNYVDAQSVNLRQRFYRVQVGP
ncbi:MAG TPA: hypothetical protein VJA21_15980 [Verrucomicrobiae bacterium]